MTDQADRERAERWTMQTCNYPKEHGWGPGGAPPISECADCLALELAKVRQQAHAEMQAACLRACTAEDILTAIKRITLDGTNALEETK